MGKGPKEKVMEPFFSETSTRKYLRRENQRANFLMKRVQAYISGPWKNNVRMRKQTTNFDKPAGFN